MRMQSVAIITLASIFSMSCGGGGDSSTAPETTSNTTFTGVFSSGVERGTITLISGTPATGKLSVSDSTEVSLSGTFTPATSTFALTGGGYTVNATTLPNDASATVVSASLADREGTTRTVSPSVMTTATTNAISGTVVGPGISGVGTLAAVATTASITSSRYCGVYTGDDSGMADIVINGSSAAGTITGMGGGFAMSGAVSGSSATLKVTGKEPGTGRTNTVTAVVVFSGTSLNGSGSSTLYPSERVTLNASSTACGKGAPAGPYTSYVGYVASGVGSTGRLTLVPGSPASGSLEWTAQSGVGVETYPLTGTYNAANGAFNVSYTPLGSLSPGITISAVATGATLAGTAQGGLLVGAQLGFVGALGSSSATPVSRYCGTMFGGSTQAPTSMNGKMIIVTAGSMALGAASWTGVGRAMTGSTGGTWVYLAGGTDIFVAGNSAIGYNGTWTHVNNSKGSFTVNPC